MVIRPRNSIPEILDELNPTKRPAADRFSDDRAREEDEEAWIAKLA